MDLRLVLLPLSAEQLAELAHNGYSIIDQGARTPGLLIVQGPVVQPPQGDQDDNFAGQPSH